jgi:hypothetical protein
VRLLAARRPPHGGLTGLEEEESADGRRR